MLILLILVVLLCGGGGYWHSGFQGGGISIVGILVLLLICRLLGLI